ncbi:universal stress protein (plasmid) [Haloferax sp. S1W]|uniref:universal stress protein n=1 Tax=Haloferax sp. S1W TaxID=3377110 RepID=UPI0037C82060
MMYDKILIPVDGSIGSERGIEYGLDIAQQHGSTVHALYVVDQRIYGDTPALSSDELFYEQLEESGESILQTVEERANDMGLDAVSVCKRGMPDEVILSYANEQGIELIVMGQHGRSPLHHPHAGSCTDRVTQRSRVPVRSV